jgi:hypothetical protein
MNANKQWATALCIIALAGCASDRMNNDTSSTGYSSGSTSSGSTGGTGSSSTSPSSITSTTPSGAGSTSSTGSGTAAGSNPVTPMTSSTAQTSSGSTGTTSSSSTAQTSYGVVQAIDQMQRQDVGVGAVGAAAAGGSTGMPSDKVYRVTVRMDDGSSQMVVVESMPTYKIGDRVRYSDGTVMAY